MSMIEVKGLSKEFMLHSNYSKKKILVLDDINLRVGKGELFCIVGPNGAGKTTLLRILSGLILPSRGEIFIKGCSLENESRIIKSLVGLVIGEERSFYWRLTARTNLEFFARLYGLRGKQVKERIAMLAALLGIEKELDRRFQECSSGNKQRLALARALLHDPEVLLLDEPTKHLDPLAAKKFIYFITEELLRKEAKTVIFATQDLSQTYLASRIAILNKGRIVAQGSLEELRENLGKPGAGMEEIYASLIEKQKGIQD
jgi:ABC-2 type transport system ATP-binding protein